MDLPFIIIGAVLGAMALAAIVFIVWAIRRANYLRNLRQRPRQTEQNIYVQLKKREESPGAREVSAPEPIYETLDSLRGTPRTNRFQQATSTDKETEGNDHRGVAAFRDPRMPVRADDGNTNEVDSALETHRESAKREVATQVSDTCDMTSASYNKRVPRVPSTSSISTCSCSSHDAVTERSPPYSVQDSTVTSKQCLRSSERHLSRHRSLQSTLEGFKTFEDSDIDNRYTSVVHESNRTRSFSLECLSRSMKRESLPKCASATSATCLSESLDQLQRIRRTKCVVSPVKGKSLRGRSGSCNSEPTIFYV